MDLGIYGAGGSGKTICDYVMRVNATDKKWDNIIFIDDTMDIDNYYGLQLYSYETMKEMYSPDNIRIIISLGDPRHRENLYNKIISDGFSLGKLILPEADISPSAIIGDGTIIGSAYIGSSVIVGENTYIMDGAIIGHDSVMGCHSIMSTNSFIAGHCHVGEKAYIGPLSAVKDRICIGKEAVTAMAAAVFTNVPDKSVAFGNPARSIPRKESDSLFY